MPKPTKMITQEGLQSLYESDLKPKLSALDALRKKVVLYNLLAIAIAVIIFLLFFAIEVSDNSTLAIIFYVIMGILAVLAVVILYKNYKRRAEYRKRYKNEVVREIVNAIDPSWNYAPELCISANEYQQSDLFRRSYDRYTGDDLISGVIDKTDFRCSELHTQYKEVTTDKDGKRQERWVTIFKGLFFHADFNKHISGNTYIEPDNMERLLGKLGQKFQSSPKGKLVKLENIEFEKIFAVYSTDQTEARYILTPAIMEALVDIYKKYKRKMYLSFIDSRVYVAMSFTKNLFEPRIYTSCVKYKDVEFMYSLFLMNEIIIKELNLNTRIWTKD